MKIYRAYIKDIAENKNLSPARQREMIFDCLKEKYKLKENQIIELFNPQIYFKRLESV